MRSVQLVALFSLLMVASCSSTQQPVASIPSPAPTTAASPPTPAATAASKPKIDACALLTSAEIKAVQGEELKETKLAAQTTDGFAISQCFYTLPTFSNSISLMVAQMADGPGAKDPEEYWRERFDAERDKDREDKDRERDRDKEKRAGDDDKKKVEGPGEEEEEGVPPQKISGVGRDAYWVGDRNGGALYVLKGNAYLRISVGGPVEQTNKMRKSKVLAQKALARM